MSEGWAGWELPASEHLRTVGEILSAPPTPEERRAERREQAEAEAKRASALDAADNAAAAGFMARLNGHEPRDPLAAAAAGEPFRDREADARRRAAIDVLRPLGLADVITGGWSGVVFDANMGILEPVPDVAQRAELDRRYEFERSERRGRGAPGDRQPVTGAAGGAATGTGARCIPPDGPAGRCRPVTVRAGLPRDRRRAGPDHPGPDGVPGRV